MKSYCFFGPGPGGRGQRAAAAVEELEHRGGEAPQIDLIVADHSALDEQQKANATKDREDYEKKIKLEIDLRQEAENKSTKHIDRLNREIENLDIAFEFGFQILFENLKRCVFHVHAVSH